MTVTHEALRAAQPGTSPRPRVRHQVRDGLVVMIFSAATSCALALMLMLLLQSGR